MPETVNTPTTFRVRISERWALPVALTAVVAFYGRLLTGSMLYSSDMLPYILGQKQLIRDALWNGRIAVYDPYTLCGTPLLSNITAGVLYPVNVLLATGSPVWGVHLFVVAHYVGATAALYALMRKGFEVSGWVSATAAVAYAVGGYAWSMSDHWYFPALPWLPLFFLGVLRILRHRFWDSRRWWLFLSTFSLTMLFLCGNFQQGYDAVVFGGILMLFGLFPYVIRRHWVEAGRLASIYAVVVISATLLASPQLLPTAIAAARSYRAGGVPLAEVEQQSFPPQRLAEYLVPFVFGVQDDFGSVLRDRYGGNFPWTRSVFIGLALLAGAAATIRRGQNPVVRWFWFVFCAGLVMAAGRHFPVYRIAYACLPGFDSFRHPEKYLLWVHFSLCVLGGYGLEQAAGLGGRRRLLWAVWGLGIGVIVLAVGMAGWRLLGADSYASWLRAGGSMWFPGRMLRLQLFEAALCLAEVLALGALLLRMQSPRVEESSAALHGPVFAVTVLHLFVVSTATQWTMPREWLEQTPTAAEFLSGRLGHAYRLFADETRRTPLPMTGDRPVFVQEKLSKYARLTVNTPSLFKLRAASGFSPLASRRYLDMIDFQRHNPLLISDMCASRYIILDGVLGAGDAPPGHRVVHVDHDYGYSILENLTAYPRIYTADPACKLVDEAEAPDAAFQIAGERHRLAAGAGLAPPPVVVSRLPDHYVQVDREHISGFTVKDDSPGRIEIACTGPAWLVVRDWRHPGWRGRLDGRQRVEVTSVDGNFLGVFVPVGRHAVELRYHVPGLTLGIVLLALGFAVLVAVWFDPLVLLDSLHTAPGS